MGDSSLSALCCDVCASSALLPSYSPADVCIHVNKTGKILLYSAYIQLHFLNEATATNSSTTCDTGLEELV